MSKKRDKARERKRTRWESTKRQVLHEVRQTISLGPDEFIPDAVLLAEVDGYVRPDRGGSWDVDHRLEPREQWFGFRLIGLAPTEKERLALGRELASGWSGTVPFGLGPSTASRRSPRSGRRRHRRSRSDG